MFKGLSRWGNVVTGGGTAWPGVATDIHIYQMFAIPGIARFDDEHIRIACSQGSALAAFHLWVAVRTLLWILRWRTLHWNLFGQDRI